MVSFTSQVKQKTNFCADSPLELKSLLQTAKKKFIV